MNVNFTERTEIMNQSLLVKDLPTTASECFGLWRLSGSYKSGGVYISLPEKESDPVFLDSDADFVRALIFLIRRDRSFWFRCMADGLERVFYPLGVGEEFYEELRFMCTCRKMLVDDRKGLTARMTILMMYALVYDFPMEFLSDRVRGDKRG